MGERDTTRLGKILEENKFIANRQLKTALMINLGKEGTPIITLQKVMGYVSCVTSKEPKTVEVARFSLFMN